MFELELAALSPSDAAYFSTKEFAFRTQLMVFKNQLDAAIKAELVAADYEGLSC